MTMEIDTKHHNLPSKCHKDAFQRAVNIWSEQLNSRIRVQVEVFWNVDLDDLAAMCVPNGICLELEGSYKAWYVSALADKKCNKNLQPDEADMAIFFSQKFTWNTSQDMPKENEYDLESLALHELCHGFGFMSLFWVDPHQCGYYGNNKLLEEIPQSVQEKLKKTFKLPELQNHPSVYDQNIQDTEENYLTNAQKYSNGSSELNDALTGQKLFFKNRNEQIQVYAPRKFKSFTSIEHLDPKIFPDSLMRPSITAGKVIRKVDDPVLKILQVLGLR